MELEINWSSSTMFSPSFRKKAASMVSEPSILGGGKWLEAQFEETMNGFERMATSLLKLHREQEAGWRRMEAKFDELKKLLLDLRFPSKGQSMTTVDEDSGSLESQLELPKFSGNMEIQKSTDFDRYESSKIADDGVEHHISVRHEEMYMELEVSKLELAHTTGNLMIVSMSIGVSTV
ncbi:hypothetical protein AAHA92_09860 [Salvia divinorum]|uniref:Uncharacterized protein n=1 Tax=Salvia divinorum TaxID=28513 RepID=A0ABD1HSR3_SALDI